MAKPSANQEVEVKTDAVKTEVETPNIEEVEVIETVAPTKKVKIKTKHSFRMYIGDKWYDFKAGEVTLVEAHIKDMLMERNDLEAL